MLLFISVKNFAKACADFAINAVASSKGTREEKAMGESSLPVRV